MGGTHENVQGGRGIARKHWLCDPEMSHSEVVAGSHVALEVSAQAPIVFTQLTIVLLQEPLYQIAGLEGIICQGALQLL